MVLLESIIVLAISAVIVYFAFFHDYGTVETPTSPNESTEEETPTSQNEDTEAVETPSEDNPLDEEEVIYTDPLTYDYLPYAYYATIPTYYYSYANYLPRRRYTYPIRPHRRFYGRGGRGGMRGGRGGMRGGRGGGRGGMRGGRGGGRGGGRR